MALYRIGLLVKSLGFRFLSRRWRRRYLGGGHGDLLTGTPKYAWRSSLG
jgi:hypothetical protein